MGFFAAGEEGFGQTLYKWVDEKGTVHFSESPPSRTPNKEQENRATKEISKKIVTSDKKEEKQTTKEDPMEILKNLEVGHRTIPEDMKKYGPGGSVAQSSKQQAGGSSSRSTGARRT